MSISSMVEPDVRRAVQPAAAALMAAGGPPAVPQREAVAAANIVEQLTRYIPTEIITVYVALLAAMKTAKASHGSRELTFWILLLATPVVVWIIFATKVRASGGGFPLKIGSCPYWKMAAAAMAFTAWAIALPEGFPFTNFNAAYASVTLLVTTVVLGLLGGLFEP